MNRKMPILKLIAGVALALGTMPIAGAAVHKGVQA